MFKSCRNLFNLSRKLGSVVIGLGLAGVLFTGQVSAVGGPRWSQSDEEHLANVVEELVNSGRQWTWEMVAEQFNSRTNQERTSVACLNRWLKLARQDERYAIIYTPTAFTSWTDGDIEHLANVVEEIVNSGRQWTWKMVAEQFNRITNEERTAGACKNKWSELARQDERYAIIYTPTAHISWTDDDIRHLANVVEELVNSGRQWTWEMVAEQFNRITNEERTSVACLMKWHDLAKRDERYARIYTPPAFTSWTNEDIGHLAYVVGELVNSGRQWTWEMVAEQFNSLTNEDRTPGACRIKWYELAEQDEHYARIYNPSAGSWTDEDIERLANVVEELVNSGRYWTWKMVAIEFNSRTNENRTNRACQLKWRDLAKRDERYARIYNPTASISWTDEDKEHLANVVGELVRAGNGINWDIVAEEFNSLTNQDRKANACQAKWHRLARQDPHYRNIYDPTSNARSEAAARRSWGSRNSLQFTQHEDESLMRLVQEHGEMKWMRIAELLGNGRTAIQCKFRYRYLLQKNRNRVPLPIPQITTASLLAAPITGSDNHATDTSNAATQSRQMLPLLPAPFPDVNINFFLNE